MPAVATIERPVTHADRNLRVYMLCDPIIWFYTIPPGHDLEDVFRAGYFRPGAQSSNLSPGARLMLASADMREHADAVVIQGPPEMRLAVMARSKEV